MPQIHRTAAAVICAVAVTTAIGLSGCAGPATTTGSAGSQSPTMSGSPTSSQSPEATPSPSTPEPVTTVKKFAKKEAIPFQKVTTKDPNLDKGTKKVTTQGVKGVLTKMMRVTYVDGERTDRTLVKKVVTRKPVDQVTTVGTRTPPPPPPPPAPAEPEPSSCDPNYSGCVPVASDVDCAGGSGDGPAYASGPVRVTGADIYGLDSDGDGVGCE
ncbi:hypothetical protein GCM10028784_02440 [Myceligenerans cantabricum]